MPSIISSVLRRLKPAPRPAAGYHSRFGGLWIDQLDAHRELEARARRDRRVAGLQDKIAHFIDKGYVILEGAVPHAAIDAYLRDLSGSREAAERLLASVPVAGPQDKAVIPLAQADLEAPLTKVLDTYVHLPSARELVFAPPIAEFLRAVFDDDILAFQGLHFEKGSTQDIHQDTAYVVSEEPMKLCASWIALEDVVAGSGELIYYPGSHRLPDWLYSGEFKHYNHERDKHEEHLAHLRSLHERSAERGLKLESFLPKKGDALIWAADLAHGGSAIRDSSLTRRSLVTHYTPASTTPYYFRFIPEEKRRPVRHRPGCSYSTMYY